MTRHVLLCIALAACGAGQPSPTAPVSTSSSPSIGGVDHVGLTVTDLETSKAFFVEELGFRVRKHDAKYPAYFLTNGVVIITLWRATDPTTAVPFNRKRNVGLHHLAFAASSFAALDALHARLRKRSDVTIEFAPELSYGGPAKHMIFREPSGNRIEVVHRPIVPAQQRP
jgi:lactoylglutathione lyase